MRGHRRFIASSLVGLMTLLAITTAAWSAQVRVATYNIQFLSTDVVNQGDRLNKLRDVITVLDAHVIGLQEIADRTALERVFPPTEWHLVIDDDSTDLQDLAVAVRKPLRVMGVPADLDADDEHFLFAHETETLFPNRRDLLAVTIQLPDESATFVVMVHHGKSRAGGRATTDPRREGAARAMIQVFERDFDDRDFILLGDFNDNPDDRSLNILETGDPNAPGGPEEIDGPFLANLTEPLMAAGHVSWGKGPVDISGEQVNTLDPGSRQRNNLARGTDQHTGMILFDQILIPVRMRDRYVDGSAKVFSHASALRGSEQTRASDHLPVFADFVFGGVEPPPPPVAAVRMLSLLPNPDGPDEGREEVTIGNGTAEEVNLTGWTLRDRAGNHFALEGVIPARDQLTITMRVFSMPLNNSGDDVSLLDPQGQVRHHVSYAVAQAGSGTVVTVE
jgi:endonuclease/exonuclease/phosphatase family metal-dependent hydrolase